MHPQAILFDWDNTLVDSWDCIQESYNLTFRHFGMAEWSMDETKLNVAKSLRDSFPQMFGARWEEAREIFYAGFESIHLDYLKPMIGAIAMLQQLKDQSIMLGVVSNKSGRFLRKEAQALGWEHFFDGRLIGALDASADKPSAAPVQMALNHSGINAGKNVWFVGDSPIDIECAVNSGCVSILLRKDPPQPGEDFPYPPEYHIENCCALTALVNDLWVPISRI